MSSSPAASRTERLGKTPIGKLIFEFALPSIVAMLTMSLYNIVDQLFIGHGVGYLGNAATNIVFPLNVLTIGMSMLVGLGAGALYSIRLGEGRRNAARKCVGNAVIMLTTISVTFSTIWMIFLQPMLGFFGATEAIMPYAVDYAGPIVFGVPFLVVGSGMNMMIRANGAPSFSMKAMVSGAILNTILDPIFIFTFGMGVKGAAIATAISQFVAFCYSTSYLLRKNGFDLEKRHFRPDFSLMGKIAVNGLSPCASQIAIMVVIILMNKTFVHYGRLSEYGAEITLAAHGITMKVNQILFSILVGIGMGTQPIFGFNYGARNYERVKQTFKIAVTTELIVGAVAFVVFFFFPQVIINMFGREEALYNEFARHCFRVFLFFTALNGFTLLSGTFFQSMAMPAKAAAIQLSRQFVFMVPAALILPRFWGLDGVLYAGPLTDGMTFVLAAVLVAREMRIINRKMAEARPPELTEAESEDLEREVEVLRSNLESTRASARIA